MLMAHSYLGTTVKDTIYVYYSSTMATHGRRIKGPFQGLKSKGYGNASLAGSRLITETFLQPTIKHITLLIRYTALP